MADDKKSDQGQPNSDDKKTALGKTDDAAKDDAKKDDTKDDKSGDEGKDKGSKAGDADAKPKAPDKYELKRPDDALFSDEYIARHEERGKKLGFSNEQLQGILDDEQSALDAIGEQFTKEAKADREIGGAKYEDTLGLAHKGLEAFLKGSPREEADAIMSLLETSRYGNHKALIRAFARLGKQVREDKPDAGGKGGGREEKSTAEVLYGKK
jgi:hypothetical protein